MATSSSSKTDEKVWLITGCSGGLGKEIALAALKRGDKVIATARSIDKLAALVDAGAHPLQLDVTRPLDELKALADEAVAVYGRVDVLVNNAGYLLAGAIEAVSPEETQALFDTNVFGVLNVTRAFLPHMRERKSGIVAIIGSVAGRISTPGVGVYCATKFALEGIAEALRGEVGRLGIAVTIIEPGYFRTSILGGNFVEARQHIADYDKSVGASVKFLAEMDGVQPGDPVKGAQRIVDVLTRSGEATGLRGIPSRLALGLDAFENIRAKSEMMVKQLDEWKELSLGTEHDDVRCTRQ
jgi:NAD(P)-dependent dehydrogenase (short-subunit alcohol dehydrogenase family)